MLFYFSIFCIKIKDWFKRIL